MGVVIWARLSVAQKRTCDKRPALLAGEQTRVTGNGRESGDEQTLQQTYSLTEVQVAFKVLMTHKYLQFA